MTKTFHCSATVWLYPGKAAWHFVSIPVEISQDIDEYFANLKRGWGSLPVQVKVGNTEWKTSIFPDKKTGSYLLPLRKEIRKTESLEENNTINIVLKISD